MRCFKNTYNCYNFSNPADHELKLSVLTSTISKLLGHANIQITLDTYVHLFENIDHDAVAQLDDEF